MSNNNTKALGRNLADGSWIDATFKKAVKEAILDHKRTGHSIAVWEDGHVKIVPPDEIEWLEDACEPEEDVEPVRI